MKSKVLFLLVTVLATLSLVMTGCSQSFSPSGDVGSQTGNLQVKITDAPDPDVEEVNVTFTAVKIHAAGGPDDGEEIDDDQEEQSLEASSGNSGKGNAGGQKDKKGGKQNLTQNTETKKTQTKTQENSSWIALDLIDNDGVTFNLLDFQNGKEKLLATADELPAGKYTQIRLEVSRVMVTLADGTELEAKLPSGNLKFVSPFEIVEGQVTELTFDWDAARSLVFTGSDQIICKPVIKLISNTVSDPDDEDSLEIISGLPNGVLDREYTGKLKASGGDKPYTWSLDEDVEDNELPPGLELDDDGSITGIPEESGEFTFTVKVTDNSDPALSASREYTINIVNIGITLDPLEGTFDEPFEGVLEGVGGSDNFVWDIVDGDLPDGLTLDAENGIISGTPEKAGKFTFTVEAVDAEDSELDETKEFTIVIAMSVNLDPLEGLVGELYEGTLTAGGGEEPYVWSLVEDEENEYPEDFTLEDDGSISFTPEEAGDFTFTVEVTDGSDPALSVVQEFTIEIAEASES